MCYEEKGSIQNAEQNPIFQRTVPQIAYSQFLLELPRAKAKKSRLPQRGPLFH
jgi:hypothetical protein